VFVFDVVFFEMIVLVVLLGTAAVALGSTCPDQLFYDTV
jgi:hypothetical protein